MKSNAEILEGYFIENIDEETSLEIEMFFKRNVPELVIKSTFDFKCKSRSGQYSYYGVGDGSLRCYTTKTPYGIVTTIPELEKKMLDKEQERESETHIEQAQGMTEEIVKSSMRQFETGATRNDDSDKLDFEGFLSPLVIEAYAEYMNSNRLQADGKLRSSDNWQLGIPLNAYMSSAWRHFFDVWKRHRGLETPEDQITNLCALMFNCQGYLHELIKENGRSLETSKKL